MRALFRLITICLSTLAIGAHAGAVAVGVDTHPTDDNVTVTFWNDTVEHPEDADVVAWVLYRSCPVGGNCPNPGGVGVLAAYASVDLAAQFDANGNPNGFALVDRLQDANGERLPEGTYTFDYHILGQFPDGTTYTEPTPYLSVAIAPKSPAPRPPAISAGTRPVHSVDDYEFTVAPHLPPHRTTADGRIAVKVERGSGDTVSFMLFAPEALTQPLLQGPPGIAMAQSLRSVTPADLGAPPGASGGMGALCERDDNPRPCEDASMDCYDVTVVRYLEGGHRQLMGTPVTISVSNPKTSQAAIDDIVADTPVFGPVLSQGSGRILEPMITRDGRLLVARGISNLTPSREGDLFYMVYPEEDENGPTEPCDVTRWTAEDAHKISHAYWDPDMHKPEGPRYGIAAYPLRDAQGGEIPDLDESTNQWLYVTYPWIDRDGDNFFYTSIGAALLYFEDVGEVANEEFELRSRYPSACYDGNNCPVHPDCFDDLGDPDCTVIEGPLLSNNGVFIEDAGLHRGAGMAGLWTHGKMVLFDNMLNNVDYGQSGSNSTHRNVTLYRDGSGTDHHVRVGTGRDNSNSWSDEAARNTTMIDSIENLFNYDPNLRPRSPRDVVWHMSTGKSTDEVVFDDYLDRSMLIFADMNASQSFSEAPFKALAYFDGFEVGGPGSSPVPRTNKGKGMGGPQRLQNAATSTDVALVAYGKLKGSTRIEPVALGGVVGKGLWLDGSSGAHFNLPDGSHAADDVHTSLFFDARETGTLMRRLVTYPDGSYAALHGASTLILVTGQGTANSVDLTGPLHPAGSWNHLAWTATLDGSEVAISLNGYPLAAVSAGSGEKFFRLVPGDVVLGYAGDWSEPGDGAIGFRGWVDELRVRVEAPNPETICNHARGRLVQLEPGGGSPWHTWAGQYATHGEIASAAGLAGGEFACVHDYETADALPVSDPATVGEPIGSLIQMPEGPLTWNRPRPSSTSNEFCRSCHDGTQLLGLHLDALVEDPLLTLHEDPRRQPLQPAPVLSGNIPTDLAGLGNPFVQTTPDTPFNLDLWLLPGDEDGDELPDNEDHACNNGVDDDGDGFADFAGGDPGCASEYSPTLENPACNDGIDNDGDGLADYPLDPQCQTAAGTYEHQAGGCGLLGLETLPLLGWIALRRRSRGRA